MVPADRLRSFAADVLASGGLPRGDAETVARLMVEADLLGAEGHGIFRLPRYMARLLAGGFNRQPDIRIVRAKGGLRRERANTGQSVMALDISVLIDPAALGAQVAAVREDIQSSARRPGFDAIRLPGDRSLGGRPATLRDGVVLSPGLVRELDELADARRLPSLQA